SCSTSSTGTPSACTLPIAANSSSRMRGASPSEGSSIASSFASYISARAVASICCSPPDSVPAICSFLSDNLGNSANECSRRRCVSDRLEERNAPAIRFSSTVSSRNGRRRSGQWTRPRMRISCAGSASMRSPAKRTSPSSTMSPVVPRFMRSSKRTRPEIARSSVDLPAPFGPTTPTSSPSSTRSDTPFRICALSYLTQRSFTSSSDMLCTQISLDHLFVLHDVGGRPVGDDLAVIDDDDAVRDRHQLLQLVLDHEHRGALGMQPPEAPALVQPPHRFREQLGLRRIEPAERLVEQQQLGLGGDGARHLEALQVALRQRGGRLERHVGDADELERIERLRLDALHPLAAAACARRDQRHHHIGNDRQVAKRPRVLEGAGDAALDDFPGLQAGDVAPLENDA